MNVPFPVQPGLPVSDQWPEMVFPLTVPDRVRLLPPGDPEATFIPNCPATLPVKFPLSAKVPLSVSPLTKQAELLEKLKLLMLSVLFELSVIEVLNASTCVPWASVNDAVQFPLMLPHLLLLLPQPSRVRAKPTRATAASFIFIKPGSFKMCTEFASHGEAAIRTMRGLRFEPYRKQLRFAG